MERRSNLPRSWV